MYKICPKCGHTRDPSRDTFADRCPNCGLIYNKWFKQRFQTGHKGAEPGSHAAGFLSRDRLVGMFLYVIPETNKVEFYVRCIVFVCLLIWGWQFILMDYYYFVSDVRIDTPLPLRYTSRYYIM